MSIDDLLPYPKTIDEISEFMSPFLSDEDSWKGKNLNIIHIFKQEDIVSPADRLFPDFVRYFYHRSCNQINESINKLWATVELHYHVRDGSDKLCREFSPNFLQTSTLPTLYYADISAIISIMSLFGVCSIVEKPDWGNTKFYNLIRTHKGIILYPRVEYLNTVFGTKIRGWHNQVLFMYEKFLKKGMKLPAIEIDEVNDLKNERNYFHYDLLSQPSMYGAFGEGKFFNHLPHVIRTIEMALNVILKVKSPLSNSCESRFETLKAAINDKLGVVME